VQEQPLERVLDFQREEILVVATVLDEGPHSCLHNQLNWRFFSAKYY
jgi:hypothetical protein